jgi:hypothetical protein
MKGHRQKRGQGPTNKFVADTRVPHPPQIFPQISHHQRLRFTNPAGANTSVAVINLLDAILIATSAVQGYQLFDQVKLKSIELWSQATLGATTPNSIQIAFIGDTGGDAGDGRVFGDTSMSIEPAHIYARPAKLSAAAMWQSKTSGMNLFSVVAPAGSVLDIEVAYRNSDIGPNVVLNALVGATTGQVYYRGCDGLPIASTAWIPIAVNTR